MQKFELNTKSSIRTVSGIYVDILDLKPEMININDIAHALSFMPRFGGHLPHFYSVAQHCYHASQKVLPGNELAALLHDAPEYILMDMPRPIKNHLTNYKDLEHNLMTVIAQVFGCQYPFNQEIKKADDIMLNKEWSTFVEGEIEKWPLIPMSQPVAKEYFLKRFHELTNNRFI